MFEIQDAAKIITESVDPNARIIFGTVRDEKLKKGEVKITVIASNFPENFTKKNLFQSVQNTAKEVTERKESFDEEKGKIYNSIPTPSSSRTEDKIDVTDDPDDEWGAVPAFLRRSKIK